MAFSNRQKICVMKNLIRKYYWDELSDAGFVSCKDEGFYWYRMVGDLLYTVRLPIFSPKTPLRLSIGFGVIPVFTWEHISSSLTFARDEPYYFTPGLGHVIAPWAEAECSDCKELLGTLPRQDYYHPTLSHYTSDGILIEHLYTPKCGAEVLQELVFPMFRKLTTIRSIYDWNKMRSEKRFARDRAMFWKSPNSLGTDIYIRNSFSQALADECLYLRDEDWYPRALRFMEAMNEESYVTSMRFESKELEQEQIQEHEHRKNLIASLKSNDQGAIDEELRASAERMRANIRKKLPKLNPL